MSLEHDTSMGSGYFPGPLSQLLRGLQIIMWIFFNSHQVSRCAPAMDELLLSQVIPLRCSVCLPYMHPW